MIIEEAMPNLNGLSRVNSPVFRIAVTVSTLWLLWTLAAAYTEYQGRPNLAADNPFSTDIEACRTVSVISSGTGTLEFVTKPNPDLMQCWKNAVLERQKNDEDNVERIIERNIERALIPVILLLLLGATFKDISSALSMSARRYWLWVIGNNHKP
jgi:hypothetical protein